MPWTCQLVTHEHFYATRRAVHAIADEAERRVAAQQLYGMMWLASEREQENFLNGRDSRRPTPQYLKDNKPRRRIITICLPCELESAGFSIWVPDCYSDTHNWKVTGDPPNLTAKPSINAVGTYHGWLTNGVLSDDTEGRTY